MELKREIESLLLVLENKNIDRATIEKDLGYSENYIDQALSRGGNNRFLRSLKQYMLQKTTTTPKVNDSDPDKILLPLGDIKVTLADYIKRIELFNDTLSNAINQGLVNLSQGQQKIQEQLYQATEHLAILLGAPPQAHDGTEEAPPAASAKKDKGVSGHAQGTDGKSKTRSSAGGK